MNGHNQCPGFHLKLNRHKWHLRGRGQAVQKSELWQPQDLCDSGVSSPPRDCLVIAVMTSAKSEQLTRAGILPSFACQALFISQSKPVSCCFPAFVMSDFLGNTTATAVSSHTSVSMNLPI